MCLVSPFYNQLEGENTECELLSQGRQIHLSSVWEHWHKTSLALENVIFLLAPSFLAKQECSKKVTGIRIYVIVHLLYLKPMGVNHHGICPYYDYEIVTSGCQSLLAS